MIPSGTAVPRRLSCGLIREAAAVLRLAPTNQRWYIGMHDSRQVHPGNVERGGRRLDVHGRVLRHLGQRQNGGAHAHLRRRITQLGIDTSHFLGQAHMRGLPHVRRRTHDQVLVAGRWMPNERPATLRRALEETGRPYLCAECGIGDQWNGRPLTLHIDHIDHIDGQFWDCRPENVRFLCPTCHSQTATYAGRNRRPSTDTYVLVDAQGNPVTQTEPTGPLSEERKLEILALVDRGEISIADAARALGRKRQYVYELQRRLATRGSLARLAQKPRISDADRRCVVETALAEPTWGERRIAEAVRLRSGGRITISASSVRGILTATGLSTTEIRSAAARMPQEHITV